MERVQAWIRWVTAAVAALWYGLPELTQLLIALMAVDVLLGVIVAIRARDLSAREAWNGITRKMVTLLMVGVAGLVNPHVQDFMEINLVQAASAFYLVPELTSIVRNAASLDVPAFVQMQGILRHFNVVSGAEKEKEHDAK